MFAVGRDGQAAVQCRLSHGIWIAGWVSGVLCACRGVDVQFFLEFLM